MTQLQTQTRSAESRPPAEVAGGGARWLNVAQAAEALGLTERHIRRLCLGGRLHAVRLKDGRNDWLVDPACKAELAVAAGLDGSLALAGDALAGLTASKRQEICRRLAIVRGYKAALAQKLESVGLVEFRAAWVEAWRLAHPDEKCFTALTLYRWTAALEARGIIGLLDRRRYSGPAKCAPEAWVFFSGMYLSPNQPSIPACYERVAALAATDGWDWPSLRTVQAWTLKKLDPKLVALGREPKKHRDRCLPYVKRDWSQVAAMACWVGDHRQFDVFLPHQVEVKDSRGRKSLQWKWHRPWLTMFMDARSWMPAAWTISFDSPTGDRVMGTFLRGVMAHGKPEHLYLDNGKDYRMYRFAGGRRRPAGKGERIVAEQHVKPILESLEVDVTWAIPYNAKAKTIESFFSIVSERFDKAWPTYVGNSPARRPEELKKLKDRAAEMQAAGYSLEAFQHAFESWLTRDYALRKSPAQAAGGLSPLRAFCELRSPDFKAVIPPEADLSLLLMPSRAVTVTQNGVWVRDFLQFYWSDALEDRRGASGRDRGRKVVYRYSPDDPSRIYVFDAVTGKFLAVATPYIGGGMNPLAAPGSRDAEKLSGQLALRRRIARRQGEDLRGLRGAAQNLLLAASRQGAETLGILDDPRSIRLPRRPRVLRLSGELSRASQAGQAAVGRPLSGPAVGVLELLARAQNDEAQEPIAAAPGVLDLLAQLEESEDGNRPENTA